MPASVPWDSPTSLARAMTEHGYLPGRGLATAVHLAVSLERPLFLEGEAGVGKTAVAHVLAEILDAETIRLQCYEGIDAGQALYDWDYPKQYLSLRAASDDGPGSVEDVYSWPFLLERPLLKALRSPERVVLLIDEIDRADDEFEAFLLEVLSTYAVTIPELGTVAASKPPIVVLTSNRTRDVHDALKRRCFYHFIEHPDVARETEIIQLKVPQVSKELAANIARILDSLRDLPLIKPPSVAESIEWARALIHIGAANPNLEEASDTLGALIKHEEDLLPARETLTKLIEPGA